MDRHRFRVKLISGSISVLFGVILCGYTQTLLPRPSGPLADYGAIIDRETELEFNKIARKLWYDYHFGLMVVTLPSEIRYPPEKYAADLFNGWGIGNHAHSYSALLVITKDADDLTILFSSKAQAVIGRKRINILQEQFKNHNEEASFTVSDRLSKCINSIDEVISANHADGTEQKNMVNSLMIILLSFGAVGVILLLMRRSGSGKMIVNGEEDTWFGGSMACRYFGKGISITGE